MRDIIRGVALAALMSISACQSAPMSTGTPCDLDTDCPAHQYCAPGGCTFDCRADGDCVHLGDGATCDMYGRCEPPLGPCMDDADC